MKKHCIFLLAVLALTWLGSAAGIGTSPGFVNYGEIQRGQTQEVQFYITTNVDEEFELRPSYRLGRKFMGAEYGTPLENVSEQNIGSWMDFSQDTYVIDPNTSQSYQLPDGTTVSAEGVITMEVTVPPNAEPGFRVGEIELNPSISGEGAGAGARVFGQTVPGFAFRVPGSVNKEIDVAEVTGIRIGENQVQTILQLRNTGTATTTFDSGEFTITESSGRQVGKLFVGKATLSPGESAELDKIWNSENVEGGEYRVEGTGEYSSGEVYISGEFVLTDTIQQRRQVDEPSGGEAEQSTDAPVVMIIIVSLLAGTLLYLMDIELTWIIMLTGGTAVSMYILLGSISNVLVLIPLASIILMLYL